MSELINTLLVSLFTAMYYFELYWMYLLPASLGVALLLTKKTNP